MPRADESVSAGQMLNVLRRDWRSAQSSVNQGNLRGDLQLGQVGEAPVDLHRPRRELSGQHLLEFTQPLHPQCRHLGIAIQMGLHEGERTRVIESLVVIDVLLNALELLVHDDVLLLLVGVEDRPEFGRLIGGELQVLRHDVRSGALHVRAHGCECTVHSCR